MAEFKLTNTKRFSRTSNAPGQRDVIRLSTEPTADPPIQPTLRLVHISDTHDGHDGLIVPDGDILIHSGDFTNHGNPSEVARFAAFLSAQPHRHKIVVAGNHELDLGSSSPAQIAALLGPGIIVLQDSGVNIDGIDIWGSSWNNCQGMAWGASESERETQWAHIPPSTDILITHNPPFGVMDLAWLSRTKPHAPCDYCEGSPDHGNFEHWGCKALRRRLQGGLSVALHLFGHVHDEVGVQQLESLRTVFSNAAMALRPTANVFDLVGRRTATPSVPGPSIPLSVASAAIHEGPIRLFAGHRKAHLLDLDKHDNSSLIMWNPIAPAPRNQRWWLQSAIAATGGAASAGGGCYYIRTMTVVGSMTGSYSNKGLGVHDGSLAMVEEVADEEQIWDISPCACAEPQKMRESSSTTVIIRHVATGGLLMRQPAEGHLAWNAVLGSASATHAHAHWVLAE